MDLSVFGIFGFTVFSPRAIISDIPGQESQKDPEHKGVIDHPDAGKSLRDQVEGIDQVNKTQNTADQGAQGPRPVFS